MTINLLFSAAALLVQAVGLALWLRLCKRVERWIWWVVTTGFFILAFHRINELLQVTSMPDNFASNVSSFTALLIAGVALIAVLRSVARIRRQDKPRLGLQAIESKLETLWQQQQDGHASIAVQIAEILSALRLQIDFYEHQAESNKLPLYKSHDDP